MFDCCLRFRSGCASWSKRGMQVFLRCTSLKHYSNDVTASYKAVTSLLHWYIGYVKTFWSDITGIQSLISLTLLLVIMSGGQLLEAGWSFWIGQITYFSFYPQKFTFLTLCLKQNIYFTFLKKQKKLSTKLNAKLSLVLVWKLKRRAKRSLQYSRVINFFKGH